MQKGRLTFSARINVSEISISETVGRGAAERAPRETDALSAPGVQSRSGLGARVPFRWPRPETGKISLVLFPRIVRLSPSLRETNAFMFKWFLGTQSGQLIKLTKGRADQPQTAIWS
jgi:hypothetical protein